MFFFVENIKHRFAGLGFNRRVKAKQKKTPPLWSCTTILVGLVSRANRMS